MRVSSRHSEIAAAWLLVMLLLAAIGIAPWDSIDARHPGVVDVAQQRFEVDLSDAQSQGPHHLEMRTSSGPEGS